MSNGALDRTTFEVIEAYVLGTMGPEDREQFERRVEADPALRAEVDLQRENIRAVELGGMLRTLEGLRAVQVAAGAGRRVPWPVVARYAAIMIVMLGAGLWWLARPSVNERLFAEHFVADPGLPVAMGVTDDPMFADGMVSYKEGKYSEARAKWVPLLEADPTNDTLRFYTAAAALAMGDAGVATPLLEGLAGEPASTFGTKAQWFLFLAYVKSGDAASASAVPLDEDVTYGERVRAIKAELAR